MAHLNLSTLREELERSQASLLAALENADDFVLYHRASDAVWSLAQVLAHISEARTFFIRETLRVAASSGAKMGRTMQDPARLAAVKDHGNDSAESLKRTLIASHNELLEGLARLRDADLELTGEHVKFGHQTLAEFVDHFILEHDQKHVAQARRCLEQARAARTAGA